MAKICWNCSLPGDEWASHCEGCGQELKPEGARIKVLADRVGYLLAELENWSLPARQREGLLAEYRGRRDRLLELAGEPPPPRPEPLPASVPEAPPKAAVAVAAAPESPEAQPELPAPGSPEPTVVTGDSHDCYSPLEAAEEAQPEHPAFASSEPAPAPVPEPWEAPAPVHTLVDDLSGFLQEQNIRWFHYLGAMLLFTSGVGYLRSQWDGAGKQVVALLLVLSPALFFVLAGRTRERLPLSSRLFSVLGGLLLPTGLLAANQFHLLGMHLPTREWSAFSFALSAAVLLKMAGRLQEVACLYLGSLSLFLALVTGAPTGVIGGLLALTLAAVFLYLGLDAESESLFKPHYYAISQGLGGLGLSCALPSLSRGPSFSPLVILLFGSLFFASSAYLTGGAGGLRLSAALASVAGFLAVRWLNLGPAALGLLGLTFGLFYLTAGRRSTEQELIDLSFRLGSALTGVLVGLGVAWQLLAGGWNNFAAVPRGELLSSLVVALLACLYYAAVAWLYRRPGWLYASAGTAAYAWFLGTVVLWQASPQLYPLAMISLPLLLQVALWALRRRLPTDYLSPVNVVGLGLATVTGALMFGQQMTGLAPFATPAVWAGTALVYGLGAAWSRQAELLYLAGASLTLSYGAGVAGPNWGLTFLPLIALLGVGGWELGRRAGREFGVPLARMALWLAFGGVFWQVALGWQGRTALVAATLFVYAGAFTVAAALYRGWVWLERPAPEGLLTLASLCLPGAVKVAWGDPALAVTTFLLLGASAALRATVARPGLELAALLWSLWLGLHHAGQPLGAVAPLLWAGALWCAAELQERTLPAVLAGVFCLSLPALASADTRLGQLALCALLVARAGWKLDWGASAWVAAGLGGLAWGLAWEQLGAKVAPPTWLTFQLVLGLGTALAGRRRPNLAAQVQRVNVTLGALLLVGACFSRDGWSVLIPALYAGLGLFAGGARRSVQALGAGSILAAVAAFQLARWTHTSVSPLWAGLGLALVLLERVTWAEGAAWLASFTFRLGLLAGFTGLFGSSAQVTLLLTGVLFGAKAKPWLAFTSFYLAYVHWLGWGGFVELRTLPLAVWLVLWADRWAGQGRKEASEACSLLAACVGLGPSLLLSLGGANSLAHAFLALVAALALTGVGMARGRNLLRTAGGLGLLAEIGIQALHVAVQLPWQLVAALVGLLLVSLGAYFERRRRR